MSVGGLGIGESTENKLMMHSTDCPSDIDQVNQSREST